MPYTFKLFRHQPINQEMEKKNQLQRDHMESQHYHDLNEITEVISIPHQQIPSPFQKQSYEFLHYQKWTKVHHNVDM